MHFANSRIKARICCEVRRYVVRRKYLKACNYLQVLAVRKNIFGEEHTCINLTISLAYYDFIFLALSLVTTIDSFSSMILNLELLIVTIL